MEELKKLEGQGIFEKLQVIEAGTEKKVFVKGQLYMSWKMSDQSGQRVAIVGLYKSGIATQDELAKAFGIHTKSIYNYITTFEEEGMKGLVGEQSGPKGSWKITPEIRGKILLTVLKDKVKEYSAIQKELEEQWKIKVSIESIRQVLIENGFIEERIKTDGFSQQEEFFENKENKQLEMEYLGEPGKVPIVTEQIENEIEGKNKDEKNDERKGLRHYSSIERLYLDKLEQGEYNLYAGGLLLVPLLQQYNYLSTMKRMINIKTYEGYCLEQLCLTLFYFDIFGFESIENFKTVYPEEFGVLISKLSSPSIFTLRRFLHKVRKLKKGEELIEEFGKEYLRRGLVNCKVLYIDEHFLPYYGIKVISMGWFTVRDRPLKGSYNFIANDEEFNPLIFLIRPSSEDLTEKIPEIVGKVKKIAEESGVDTKELTVIFDREGYSAELFRTLDGEDGNSKIRFITWAKYADKWVNDFKEEEFKDKVTVRYKIQKEDEIKYFETEREMSKYGKIRAIVIESGRNKQRSAIYTNDTENPAERIVQLICRRWGQENCIKTLKLRHLIDYHPGYVSEELEEQPLVDNPELEELRQRRAGLTSQLHGLQLKLAEKVLDEKKEETNLRELKEAEIEIFSEIAVIKSQITLLNQEMDKLPKEVKFDSAHDGTKLCELDYEKKRFLDCIKVFAYHMENKMCEILINSYDKKKELWPALAMILRRGAYIKLEQGNLTVKLRRFKNPEIDFAARHLCQELNQMHPVTLDKFNLPLKYEVI
jgi:transposase